MASEDRVRLETTLRRIDELASSLAGLGDPIAHEHARELLDSMLDLHGVALARMMATVAGSEGGTRLIEAFAEDERVQAVLLLHGLHPDDLETRVRGALKPLRSGFGLRGLGVDLLGASRRSIRLRVRGPSADPEALRRELEAALFETAPEVDAIDIDFVQGREERPVLAAAVG